MTHQNSDIANTIRTMKPIFTMTPNQLKILGDITSTILEIEHTEQIVLETIIFHCDEMINEACVEMPLFKQVAVKETI